jgi:hypothetical protein
MDSHIFNEQEKRFEPTSTTCSFCKKNTPEAIYCDYIQFFKEKDKIYIISFGYDKFLKKEVGIPCCKNCHEIREEIKVSANMSGLMTGFFIFLGFIYLAINSEKWVGFIGFFVALYGGGFLSKLLLESNTKKKGILLTEDVINSDEMCRDFLMRGWSRTMPKS